MIDSHLVQTFMALARVGNFTRTADELGLTQAAVSQHIRRLEDQLGPLLIRRARQTELTPAGQALLEYGKTLAQAGKRLETRLADLDGEDGEISLISPGSVGLLLYPMLLGLQERHPGLSIRHRFAPDREVLAAVAETQYELGITTVRPDDSRLVASRFAQEPLELVLPAHEEGHSWEDLQRIGFIDHPDGQAMAARLLDRYFPHNHGIRTLPVRGFSNQIGLILEPVARGLGFTVIPRYARQAFGKPDRIRVVETPHPVVDTLWLIHRSEWPLPARATRVLEYLHGQVPQAWQEPADQPSLTTSA